MTGSPPSAAPLAGRHWSARWVGWRYEAGRRECLDFVAEVLREEFEHRLDLPRPLGVRERDRLAAAALGEFARPLDRPPREGDGVLMRALGRRGIGHHVGIWCAPASVPSVLHAQSGLGGVLHPLADLHRAGLALAGLYAWR